jgi:pyruvate formate lyase activating enzyme
MGGTLRPVLETIERLKGMGFWLEVVTLVVPGLNDSEKELSAIAQFLASVSRDIPWHVTAFHPDYKMEDRDWTEAEQLNLGWEIGKSAGLRYVYSGNRPGEVGKTENTDCPSCGALLIERVGFRVIRNLLGPDGTCPKCSIAIPGVWKVPSREPNLFTKVETTPLAEKALTESSIPE